MTTFIDAVTSPWAFFFALIVFGFAPGALLRLVILAFPKDDPRRAERLAELYEVPRIERPIWVAEQLDRALIEGLTTRYKRRQSRRRDVTVITEAAESGATDHHRETLAESVSAALMDDWKPVVVLRGGRAIACGGSGSWSTS